jgi:hypothetical protein
MLPYIFPALFGFQGFRGLRTEQRDRQALPKLVTR